MEIEHSIHGVPGRLWQIPKNNGLWSNQTWKSGLRTIGPDETMRVNVRYDDSCNNGHNSFAITADTWFKRREASGGCLHDEIKKHFPELARLIPWHLCSADGPMHYVANTVYHASDRDYDGLLKGERRQIRNGRTGALCWELVAINSEGVGISTTETGLKYQGAETVPLYLLTKNAEGETPPLATPELRWVPWCRESEGKARELDHARSCAIWPEATDADLLAPDLKEKLLARLPDLLARFRHEIETAGLAWSSPC